MRRGVRGLSSCKVLELNFEKCGRRVFSKMKKKRHIYISGRWQAPAAVLSPKKKKKKKKKKARSLEGPKGPRVAETCESEGPKGPRTS